VTVPAADTEHLCCLRREQTWARRSTTRLRLVRSGSEVGFSRDAPISHGAGASRHPRTVQPVWSVRTSATPPPGTVDGEPERNLLEDLRPYWIAVFAFAEALVVSNLASARPRLQSLSQALETIGTMRELEREGRLTLTARDDGTLSIGVAADYEGAEPPPT
jgi:hypothetical protein